MTKNSNSRPTFQAHKVSQRDFKPRHGGEVSRNFRIAQRGTFSRVKAAVKHYAKPILNGFAALAIGLTMACSFLGQAGFFDDAPASKNANQTKVAKPVKQKEVAATQPKKVTASTPKAQGKIPAKVSQAEKNKQALDQLSTTLYKQSAKQEPTRGTAGQAKASLLEKNS